MRPLDIVYWLKGHNGLYWETWMYWAPFYNIPVFVNPATIGRHPVRNEIKSNLAHFNPFYCTLCQIWHNYGLSYTEDSIMLVVE